jgi:nitrogen regulation protein NR(I)
MNGTHRICLIDDDVATRVSLERVLTGEGYEVIGHPDGKCGLAAALEQDFDCVLTDLRMPDISGMELVDKLREELPNLPVVLMTAHGTTETAIEAIRRGAFDYILKPFEMEELLSVVARASDAGRRGRVKVALGSEAAREMALVGQSRPMQGVYKEIGRVAERPVSIMILGETGTGKELVARALWQHGDRQSKAFVAVNCAAIPANLLESELFGHERGAFTGAESRRIGRFEQADGGTLFLDEIGDLSMETQVKLLRVLQERVIARVGGQASIAVNVRMLAATHRDLPALVASGKFREDLYYRLNVAVITVPPLRERREDIPALVSYFVSRHGADLGGVATVQPAALKYLSAQPWPGNVRQLENVVKRMLLIAHGYAITEDLARAALQQGPSFGAVAETAGRTLAALCEEALINARREPGLGAITTVLTAVEHELLAQAHAVTSGNITQMAQLLGWSRLTVREKLILYGLRRKAAGETGADK